MQGPQEMGFFFPFKEGSILMHRKGTCKVTKSWNFLRCLESSNKGTASVYTESDESQRLKKELINESQ